jgi:hypothetical protein
MKDFGEAQGAAVCNRRRRLQSAGPCCSIVRAKSLSYRRNFVTPRVSPIHFAHHNIDAAEDNHHIGDGVTETEVFQYR